MSQSWYNTNNREKYSYDTNEYHSSSQSINSYAQSSDVYGPNNIGIYDANYDGNEYSTSSNYEYGDNYEDNTIYDPNHPIAYGENEGNNPYVTNEEALVNNMEGQWNVQVGEYLGPIPISSMVYDTSYEMIWCGQRNGRMTGYIPTYLTDETTRISNYLQLRRVISYESSLSSSSSSSLKESIIQVLSWQGHVVVVSDISIRIHSTGGLCLYQIELNTLLTQSNKEFIVGTIKISDACFVTNISYTGILSGKDRIENSYLFIGTDNKILIHWDMNPYIQSNIIKVAVLDISSPSTVCKCNGNITLVGCQDGKVRYFDTKFRANKVLGTLDAHTGPVSDIVVHSDGILVFTCGFLDRLMNSNNTPTPATTSATNSNSASNHNHNHVPDPLVKIFDLRTSKLVGSLTMTLSTPRRLIMIPTITKKEGIDQMMMISGTGIIQINDIHGSNTKSRATETGQVLSLPLANKQDHITSVVASSSGQVICCSTFSGFIFQIAIGLQNQQNPTINSIPIEFYVPPLSVPSAPLFVPMDSPTIASSYVFRSNYPHMGPLASSFLTTPTLLNKKWKLYSNKKVSLALMNKATKRDFMSTLSNPGYPLNSMLSVKSDAYSRCDPRFTHFNKEDEYLDEDGDVLLIDNNIIQMEKISITYRRNVSHRSSDWKGNLPRHQMTFDYNQFNGTEYIGLENSSPNAYTNTMIRFLFMIPSIRQIALKAQTLPFYYNNPVSLWCELGFLFHMIAMKSNQRNEFHGMNQSMDIEKIVIPSNFQRTFQLLPEVAALGLLDTSQSDAQSRIVNFIRFFLQHLQVESENEYRQAVQSHAQNHIQGHLIQSTLPLLYYPIESTFSYQLSTTMMYLQSGTQDKSISSKSLAIDLIYSSSVNAVTTTSEMMAKTSVSSGNNTSSESIEQTSNISFATILWHSLQKETKMRAWCSSSGSYERSKQLRSVISIPNIVGLLCGDTNTQQMRDKFWLTKNPMGGSCLPSIVEIAMLKDINALPNDKSHKDVKDVMPNNTVLVKKLIISILLQRPTKDSNDGENKDDNKDKNMDNNKKEHWIIYDGVKETDSDCPYSHQTEALSLPNSTFTTNPHSNPENDLKNNQSQYSNQHHSQSNWEVHTLNLIAVISNIGTLSESTNSSTSVPRTHTILHYNLPSKSINTTNTSLSSSSSSSSWFIFNDFTITPSDAMDATSFSNFKYPAYIAYAKQSFQLHDQDSTSLDSYSIPTSVLAIPSLSNIPSIRLSPYSFQSGDYVAFDGEFVSVELSKSEIGSDGQRKINADGRQVLARMSLVDDKNINPTNSLSTITLSGQSPSTVSRVLIDDYILPGEPVLDYVTRYSGITEEDLSPINSTHAVVTRRTAYLKLRHIIDKGIIFVGHGLQKDFEIANVVVPIQQVKDTVELWRLPSQRKISLRFLASYLLKKEIQDEIHDSVEDAKTTLQLYRHYEEVMNTGKDNYQALLNKIYKYGNRNNWTIGFDEFDPSSK